LSEAVIKTWQAEIDFSQACWDEYKEVIQSLLEIAGPKPEMQPEMPTPAQLQRILPKHVVNQSGQVIRLLSSDSLPDIDYEQHIFLHGEVSTRENSWHDLFNALVWSRFAAIKAAMNAVHFEQVQKKPNVQRGPVRDALTLFDECGVVITSADSELLKNLAKRDWKDVFVNRAAAWGKEIQIYVTGHALLEKFLNPYKSLTAHALLVQTEFNQSLPSTHDRHRVLDSWLGQQILTGKLLRSTAELSPIPLMGIPSWWTLSQQDEAFYSDLQVFRPPPAGFHAAPVLRLDQAS
jgi:hypothetical protein